MKRSYLRFLFSLCFIPFLFSCASPSKSAITGGAIGTGLGGTVGAIADPGPDGTNRVRNVLIGGAIGGAIGIGGGLLTDKLVQDQRDAAYQKGRSESQKEIFNTYDSSLTQPQLVPPKTEAKWIPDQIRGNTFVPGHFEYVIVEGAKWESGK